jgi:hypothetical protein
MSRKTCKITALLMTIVAVVGLVIGCGSSGVNNDQGTSFLALGFFDDPTGQVGRTGDVLPLSNDVQPDVFNDSQYWVFIGLANRLSRQFIRVVRIDCDYKVEGSFINIPSDSYAYSTVLGPVGEAQNGGQGQQPQNDLSQTVYAGFQILSPDIFSFLNNNRVFLPSLPFRMVATCSATGVTQAGNTMTTNPLNFSIQFVRNEECCTGGPGPGFQQGVGTGGDF